ncbi:MAG: PAS domain-containing protein, partial [Acidobacteria bacterium]|nr:PAS domain-containing protein [Acidobacteriota bacterium]
MVTLVGRGPSELAYVLERMSDGLLLVDFEWRCTWVNARAAAMCRQRVEHLLGRCVWDVFPELVGTAYQEELQRAARERVTIRRVGYYPPFQRWCETEAFPTAGGLAVFLRDITERKQIERSLRESRERLSLALSVAEVGTWRWDLRSGLDTRDESLNALLGLDAVESTQPVEDFLERVHPEDRPKVQAALAHAVDEGAGYDVDLRIVRPGGEVRWLRDQGRVFCNRAGSPSYMTGACVDITERKLAEAALRHSEERYRAFIAQ